MSQNESTKNRKIIIVFNILGIIFIMTLIVVFLPAFFTYLSPHGPYGDDSHRIRDIRELKLALEIYRTGGINIQGVGRYPSIEIGCQEITILKPSLEPTYIQTIPEDPRRKIFTIQNHPNYQIAIAKDGSSYVLKTTIRNKENRVLQSDLDGNVLGCDCNDPNYCILE